MEPGDPENAEPVPERSNLSMQHGDHELQTLNDVAVGISQLADVKEVLDFALDMVVSELGMESGVIYLYDEATDRFDWSAYRGMSQELRREIDRRRESGTDLVQRIARMRETLFVRDMSGDVRFAGLWDDLSGRSYLNFPLMSRGGVVGTMGLVGRSGRPMSDQQVEFLKAVGWQVATAIDNALLLENTRRSEREATTLYDLSLQISASLEPEQVYSAVAEAARKLLSADIGLMGLYDEGTQELAVRAVSGGRTEALSWLRVPIGEVPAGADLLAGRPIIMEQLGSAALLPRDVEAIRSEGVESFLMLPIWRGPRLYGFVMAMERQHRRFLGREVRLMSRLTTQVITSIENAYLYRRVKQLAVLEERDRLARELHDSLAQSLGYLNLKASIVGELLDAGQDRLAREGLTELKKIVGDTYTDVREAIFGLRATVSSGSDFLPMMREYLAEYGAHYGLKARLEEDDHSLPVLSAEATVQVVRIIQEALANVRRHAQAKNAWVRITQVGEDLRISVEDDGQGFDMAEVGQRRGAFGLQIMRERAQAIGGRLEIDTAEGRGTRVTLLLPDHPVSQSGGDTMRWNR